MRTITKTVFQFSELSEEAKEKAREWYRRDMEFAWCDESKLSIRTFCEYFGAKLINWSIGPYSPLDYDIEFDNSCFRNVKLKSFTGEECPTGYCLDYALWNTFHKVFKKTGDCKYAFLDAVHTGFSEWKADMEWQLSDEYTDETIEANDYEFYENGEIA